MIEKDSGHGDSNRRGLFHHNGKTILSMQSMTMSFSETFEMKGNQSRNPCPFPLSKCFSNYFRHEPTQARKLSK